MNAKLKMETCVIPCLSVRTLQALMTAIAQLMVTDLNVQEVVSGGVN